MTIKITLLYCPDCQSTKINKNGKKHKSGKQNFRCNACVHQLIGDHAMSYRGCRSSIIQKILLMFVRGIGIRDISEIDKISIKKVLSVLVNSHRIIGSGQQHYGCLEVDEFWTYVGSKKNKLIRKIL